MSLPSSELAQPAFCFESALCALRELGIELEAEAKLSLGNLGRADGASRACGRIEDGLHAGRALDLDLFHAGLANEGAFHREGELLVGDGHHRNMMLPDVVPYLVSGSLLFTVSS